MNVICECGAQMQLINSRIMRGQRYRRFQCPECGQKTTRLGENADQPLPAHRVRSNRRFDNATIREIRSSMDGPRVLAERYGCSRETIREIRRGRAYRDLLPEDFRPPEPGDPTCDQCRFWEEGCTMGFPDPAEEGLRFARDCSVFEVEG